MAVGTPWTWICRSDPASCSSGMTLSRCNLRHSATLIEPLPTMTSTRQVTSSIPENGFGSVLDDEVGEEDIRHLHRFHDVRGAFGDFLLESRFAVGGHDVIG